MGNGIGKGRRADCCVTALVAGSDALAARQRRRAICAMICVGRSGVMMRERFRRQAIDGEVD
jgi:hypothetical protein